MKKKKEDELGSLREALLPDVAALAPLTDADFDRLHAEYMAEMHGETPFLQPPFNIMFCQWAKYARQRRFLGFRNVNDHYLNLRYPDKMPQLCKPSVMHLCNNVCCAIPTMPALLAMVDTHYKMAEVGAGSGFLAQQLTTLGADIVCCDIDTTVRRVLYRHMQKMDGRAFLQANDGFPDRALLMCYGYYKDGIPEQYEEMIDLYKGDFIYLIGEHRQHAATFNLSMCKPETQQQWEKIGIFDLPSFRDYQYYSQLVLYQRIKPKVNSTTLTFPQRGPTHPKKNYL